MVDAAQFAEAGRLAVELRRLKSDVLGRPIHAAELLWLLAAACARIYRLDRRQSCALARAVLWRQARGMQPTAVS